MSNLALHGGQPVRKDRYPAWPVHDERDIATVTEVIKSGRWGGYPYPGPQTAEFTRRTLRSYRTNRANLNPCKT